MNISRQSSIDSDLESINLSNNIKRIKNIRNRTRIYSGNYIGALAIDIIWEDNSETREPIQNLINSSFENINQCISELIEDYRQTAIKYPFNNRCCLMCWNKVYNGNILCNNHLLT